MTSESSRVWQNLSQNLSFSSEFGKHLYFWFEVMIESALNSDDVWDDRFAADDDDSAPFAWTTARSHYSVIILNDRLMSETLLSDDDDHRDDADGRHMRLTRPAAKRRSSSSTQALEWPEGHSPLETHSSEKVTHTAAVDPKRAPPPTLAALLNNPCLPPTPPSSQCGSDSEAVSRLSEMRRKAKATTATAPPLISTQPKNAAHGSAVQLTDEERRTLSAEGYPIPARFPLTKAEERSLKKIRRKIKNKISAQESRRKKKEYMEELERRVQTLDARVRELERENKHLLQNK